MVYFLVGLAIFFGVHVYSMVRSRAPGSDMRKRMGEGPFMALYALLSLAGFVLMIYGYGEARPNAAILYAPPAWGRHVTLALMLPALILLVAAYTPAGYISAAAKHPMLAAVKVWAFGHLFANGDLVSVVLFGSFLLFGVADRIAVKRRGNAGTSPDVQRNVVGDLLALGGGAIAYVAIAFYLHPILFGVPAVP